MDPKQFTAFVGDWCSRSPRAGCLIRRGCAHGRGAQKQPSGRMQTALIEKRGISTETLGHERFTGAEQQMKPLAPNVIFSKLASSSKQQQAAASGSKQQQAAAVTPS